MKIGINASWMTPGAAGGHEWYVRNLIERLGVIDTENDYLLVAAPNNFKTWKLPNSRWEMCVYVGDESAPGAFRTLPCSPALEDPPRVDPLRRLYRRLRGWYTADAWTGRLGRLIAARGVGLWFCPFMWALPTDTDVPIVVNIPDLQQEHLPHFFDDDQTAIRSVGYQYSAKIATATIAVSEFSAADIVQRYGIEPDRVLGIPLGIDPSLMVSPQLQKRLAAASRLAHRLDGDFIFYPSAGWPHKNHDNLVRALAIVKQQVGRVKLVLTGWKFDVMQRLRPLLRELGLQDDVLHLGYINRTDLIGLYAAASLVAFPSMFEGFGLPVAEAMHFGTPVACSNAGSLGEVGGDAVLQFDPTSVDQMAECILRILTDAPTRQRLAVAGPKRAEQFSYDNVARRHLELFNRIRDGRLKPPGLPPFRPVIPHKWIFDGHARWYFHAVAPRKLSMRVIQPTTSPDLAEQTVRVLFNGQVLFDGPAPSRQTIEIDRDLNDARSDGFHCIEVVASKMFAVKGEKLSVQISSLTVTNASGRLLKLVP
jgi:glycosyltransferase involved in cell wall biosynthesis